MCDCTADKIKNDGIHPEVKAFEEELGISPERHQEIDARLDKILQEFQNGELKIAGTRDELFEHWDEIMAGKQ